MFEVLLLALLVTAALAVLRIILGPDALNRLVAVNTLGTSSILLLASIGFVQGRPDFIDLALLYALVNWVGTIAVVKFFASSFGANNKMPSEGERRG